MRIFQKLFKILLHCPKRAARGKLRHDRKELVLIQATPRVSSGCNPGRTATLCQLMLKTLSMWQRIQNHRKPQRPSSPLPNSVDGTQRLIPLQRRTIHRLMGAFPVAFTVVELVMCTSYTRELLTTDHSTSHVLPQCAGPWCLSALALYWASATSP